MLGARGVVAVGLSIVAVAMLSMLYLTSVQRNSQTRRIPTIADRADETVSVSNIRSEPTQEEQVGVRYSTPVPDAQSKMGIRGSVWAAPDAASGLRIALHSGLPIEDFGDYLVFARSTCRAAGKLVSEASIAPETDPSSTRADDIAAKDVYWTSFCRNFQSLVGDFDAAIESAKAAKLATNPAAMGEIIGAAADSPAAASALIDEILFTRTPTYASVIAANLFTAISPGKSLAQWQRLLPGNLSSEDRLAVLTLAGEHVICLNAPGTCAANTPAVMMSCSRICRTGEDLLSFRRRTTSPMLFEASERIAAEMLKRRAK